MKKFIIEQPFFDILPEAKIGAIVCHGIDNHIHDEDKFADYLENAQKLAAVHIQNPTFTENPIIKAWREAFYKFKTKKGARCSIEALLKRVSKGNSVGTINPLVDLYNSVSMKHGVPIGGENIDAMEGNMRLTVADGGEEFVTLGSEKSEPPYPGEIVYKDDAGAICRCFNWRESVRTMLTEDTTNAFLCFESVDPAWETPFHDAIKELKQLVEEHLGGQCQAFV
ncbi:MAG: B3/4 domain-containing protein, partial [Bacillota bacterium]|nr:B3/4 domain-containing protein [Bacillota bacterium]